MGSTPPAPPSPLSWSPSDPSTTSSHTNEDPIPEIDPHSCREALKSQMSRPLRSASITEASALLRAGPPACPHRYSTPHSFCCSTHSLSPPTTLSGSRSPYRHTPSHVPCSSRRPDSRHLHTGHRLACKRISRQTYPEVIHTPRF